MYAAILEFTDDAELRQQTRTAHRDYLRELLDAGKLRMSGPWVDDTGALMILEADSLADAQALLDADPYQPAGVIANATIKEWKIVLEAERSI